MRIVDETVLDRIRETQLCGLCGARGPVDPHHYLAKGMGGGGRLDVWWNVLPVCRICHTKIHAGNISRRDVLEAIARRPVTPEDIECFLWGLLRIPK